MVQVGLCKSLYISSNLVSASKITGCGLMAKSLALGARHHGGSSPLIPTKRAVGIDG